MTSRKLRRAIVKLSADSEQSRRHHFLQESSFS